MSSVPDVAVWWGSLLDADVGLLPLLSQTERDRVASLERPADRGRSLVGAALLRTAVATDLGCAPEQVQLDRTCSDCGDQHGRAQVLGPLPSGRHTPPWVSVSHSGHLVAVALCRTHPVGIDVQRTADLAEDVEPWSWVRREAHFKSGAGDGPCDTQPLETPLVGYRAALTVAGT